MSAKLSDAEVTEVSKKISKKASNVLENIKAFGKNSLFTSKSVPWFVAGGALLLAGGCVFMVVKQHPYAVVGRETVDEVSSFLRKNNSTVSNGLVIGGMMRTPLPVGLATTTVVSRCLNIAQQSIDALEDEEDEGEIEEASEAAPEREVKFGSSKKSKRKQSREKQQSEEQPVNSPVRSPGSVQHETNVNLKRTKDDAMKPFQQLNAHKKGEKAPPQPPPRDIREELGN